MKKETRNITIEEGLELLFHQPHRLNIMAELCGANQGKTFGELKELCSLTDGNLSRHLQALEKTGVIKIKKSFLDSKPLTTVFPTQKGREKFLDYLTTLEGVLKHAAKRAGCDVKEKQLINPLFKTVKA